MAAKSRWGLDVFRATPMVPTPARTPESAKLPAAEKHIRPRIEKVNAGDGESAAGLLHERSTILTYCSQPPPSAAYS